MEYKLINIILQNCCTCYRGQKPNIVFERVATRQRQEQWLIVDWSGEHRYSAASGGVARYDDQKLETIVDHVTG